MSASATHKQPTFELNQVIICFEWLLHCTKHKKKQIQPDHMLCLPLQGSQNPKNIKLFIVNNFYNKLINISAKVRLLKLPEPYKGKGILFKNELLKLKKK